MNIKLITYENIPCWYDLSWDESEKALILSIHRDFIEGNKIDLGKAPILQPMTERLHLPPSSWDFSKNIGFGEIFERIGEEDNFIKFRAKIPQVKKLTGNKCKECKGTGKRSWGDNNEKCLYCNGTGKEWTMDWKDVKAISATLTILTIYLRHSDTETSAPYPQLLTVQTITEDGMHGGSLSGDISIPLYNFLKTFGEHAELSKAIRAMKFAHDTMVGNKELYQHSFGAYVKNGHFIINCPGDACGLHPADWYAHEGHGYEFSGHNVDSAIQQITLLVGLATLNDMARREL